MTQKKQVLCDLQVLFSDIQLSNSREDKAELFQIAEIFKAKVIDYGKDSLLLEFVQTATKNDAVVKLIKEEFHRIEVVRGGSVGIESISMMER